MKLSQRLRRLVDPADLVAIVGLGLLTVGLWSFRPAVALVALGSILMIWAFAVARASAGS